MAAISFRLNGRIIWIDLVGSPEVWWRIFENLQMASLRKLTYALYFLFQKSFTTLY